MKASPQRLRRPFWCIDSPAPLRRLPGARREVKGPGAAGRAVGALPAGWAIVRPDPRGRSVVGGTGQPPSPDRAGDDGAGDDGCDGDGCDGEDDGSGSGSGAGSGVPRRTTVPSGPITR